jgi:hypothetical protein
MSSLASGTAVNPLVHKEVRIDAPPSHGSDTTAVDSEKSQGKKSKAKVGLNPQTWKWPPYLSWVPEQLNWHGLKPVLRSAIAAWIVDLSMRVLMFSLSSYCYVQKLKTWRAKPPFSTWLSPLYNRLSTRLV